MTNELNNFNDVDTLSYLKSATKEVKYLESNLKKKTLAFQRLPFHKRRRNKNYIKRKTFLRKLEGTHRFYAKRYFMINLFDRRLPYKRTEKTLSFISKSYHRGYMYDESYMNTYIINKDINVKCYNEKFIRNNLIIIKTIDELKENENYEEYGNNINNNIKEIQENNINNINNNIKEIQENNINNRKLDYKIIKIIGKDFKEGEYKILNKKLELISVEININSEMFILKENGIVSLFLREDIMRVWNYFIIEGIIPVGLEELERIGIENNILFYPMFYLNDKNYTLYEKEILKEEVEKYRRTPKGKKVERDFYLPKDKYKVYFFKLEKGKVNRIDKIYKNNTAVGYIIKNMFCRKNGCIIGYCALNEEWEGNYMVENGRSKIKYEIKMLYS